MSITIQEALTDLEGLANVIVPVFFPEAAPIEAIAVQALPAALAGLEAVFDSSTPAATKITAATVTAAVVANTISAASKGGQQQSTATLAAKLATIANSLYTLAQQNSGTAVVAVAAPVASGA